MTLTRAPAHALAGSLCCGLALANLHRAQTLPLACGVLSAAALVAADAPAARLAFACVALASVGCWWATVRLDSLDRSPLAAALGEAGRAVVVVTGRPVRGRFGIRADGFVRRFRGAPVGERAALELSPARSPPQGAVLAAVASVRMPRGAAHGFDERTWLRRRGIHVVLRIGEWRRVGRRGGVGGLADRLHRALAHAIAPGVTGERRAVLEGIVLGDDAQLPPSLRRDFQASGLYHLLAVSGQNVVLIAGGVLVLAWLLGVSRFLGELGALAAIAAYVLAVGPQPSVIRAGVAGTLASLAWLTGRLRDAWYALLVAAVALLAWNPYTLLDPGFQLSFAAVVAIFVVAPRLSTRLERLPLPRPVRTGVAVSAGCGLVTAPIVWFQFGYLPLLSVPANALAEPAMPLLLGLAFLAAALDAVSPSAARAVAWLDGWVAAYLALCAHAVGSLPYAEVTTWRGLAGVAGVLVLAAYACARWRRS